MIKCLKYKPFIVFGYVDENDNMCTDILPFSGGHKEELDKWAEYDSRVFVRMIVAENEALALLSVARQFEDYILYPVEQEIENEILDPDKMLTFKEARKKLIKDFEREYFLNLLAKHKKNITHVAKEAGINRKSVYRVLESLGISPQELRL